MKIAMRFARVFEALIGWRALAVLASPLALPAHAFAQCEPGWSSQFGPGQGLDQGVFAMAVFDDDGDGPRPPGLYVGGNFTTAGGVQASYIARWDGTSWSDVGGGVDNDVDALAVLDEDGPGPLAPALYVLGEFSHAGGSPANHIARWDGTSWSTLSTGIDLVPGDAVLALGAFDEDGPGPLPPALFVGGRFSTAGGVPVHNLARWRGGAWSAIGSLNNLIAVQDFAVYDDDGPGPHLPALMIAAGFDQAVLRWDGSNLTTVGSFGQSGGNEARALVVFDEDGPGPEPPKLFLGGNFTYINSVTTGNVAQWDGTNWSALAGNATNEPVNDLIVFDDDGPGPHAPALYATGWFTHAGHHYPMNGIGRYDGTSWTALDGGIGPAGSPEGNRLAVYDPDGDGPRVASLYAGGYFDTTHGGPGDRIARWSGCGSALERFCFGDATAAACPCSNTGAIGHGCENSAATGGAVLSATGHTGLSADSLVLVSTGELPSALTVFLQGNASVAPIHFGDGLRCVGGSLKRLYTESASGGIARAPAASEPRVSQRSAAKGDAFIGGALRFYQAYYRDPNLAFCPAPTGNTFNVSNGIAAAWSP